MIMSTFVFKLPIMYIVSFVILVTQFYMSLLPCLVYVHRNRPQLSNNCLAWYVYPALSSSMSSMTNYSSCKRMRYMYTIIPNRVWWKKNAKKFSTSDTYSIKLNQAWTEPCTKPESRPYQTHTEPALIPSCTIDQAWNVYWWCKCTNLFWIRLYSLHTKNTYLVCTYLVCTYVVCTYVRYVPCFSQLRSTSCWKNMSSLPYFCYLKTPAYILLLFT